MALTRLNPAPLSSSVMLSIALLLVALAQPSGPTAAPTPPVPQASIPFSIAPPQPYAQDTQPLREEIASGLLAEGQQGVAMLREFSVRYPDDWRRLLDDLVARVQRGDSEEELGLTMYVTMRSFTARNGHFMGLAPDDRLLALLRNQVEQMEALLPDDPGLCATIFTARLVPPDARLNARAAALMEQGNVLTVVAMDEGRRQPVRRTLDPTADQARVVAAYRAAGGLAMMHDDPAAFRQTAAADQCRAGVALYRSVLTGPPDLAVRWIAAQFTQPERTRDRPI